MWEQRMQEKQGLANPAPPGQHGVPQKNDSTSFLDQMNPASRAGVILSPNNMPAKAQNNMPSGFQKATAFENPQTIIQIPQVAPGQIEAPR